jgi:hypothetical protein
MHSYDDSGRDVADGFRRQKGKRRLNKVTSMADRVAAGRDGQDASPKKSLSEATQPLSLRRATQTKSSTVLQVFSSRYLLCETPMLSKIGALN